MLTQREKRDRAGLRARLLARVAALLIATTISPSQAGEVAVGEWIRIRMEWPAQDTTPGGNHLDQRYAITGEQTDADGQRWVWLEMTIGGRYPIRAKLLVPATLFERSQVSQEGLFSSARGFVGSFGGAAVREFEPAEASGRLGGYIALGSCPRNGKRLGASALGFSLSDLQRRCQVGDAITRLDAAGVTLADHFPFAFKADRDRLPGRIFREPHVSAQITD